MTYQQLKSERQSKYDQAITKNGIFFAFSREQLEEGMKEHPLSEGDKYISMKCGGFIRKSQIESYFSDCDEINKWFKLENEKIKQDKAERTKAILYELCNYECFYTNDIWGSDAWAVLKEQGYDQKEVREVYKRNYYKFAEQ